MSEQTAELVRVCAVHDLREGEYKPYKLKNKSVLLIKQDGRISAIDNRCPHMGYPLSQGTMKDGLLRCHWHHWRFDVKSGGCFTSGGDDVPTFPVEVRGEEVWVSTSPQISFNRKQVQKATDDLEQGIRENTTFLIAKAVAGLKALHVDPEEMVRIGADYGCRYRQQGFGSGMTTLSCLNNMLSDLEGEGHSLGLVHGLVHVARDIFNEPVRRFQRPVPDMKSASFEQLKQWFRLFVEEREAVGAERCLLTVLEADRFTLDQAAEMIVLAATDHFFLSTGHVLDFTNKAFELVDRLGEEQATRILPGIVPPLASGFRHEEDGDWSDFAKELRDFCERLPHLYARGQSNRLAVTTDSEDDYTATDHTTTIEDHLLRIMLKGTPTEILRELEQAVTSGALLKTLSRALVRAGIHRVARFHVQNEFDWDQVHHLFSYAHGLDRLVDRIGGNSEGGDVALLKGIAHGAMYAYLTYFLNMPAAKLPAERKMDLSHLQSAKELNERLLHCAEFQQVEEAGCIVYEYLQRGYNQGPLLATIGLALLKEDAAFHTIQDVEAAFGQYRLLGDHPDATLALVAAARYMTAQKLRRGILWSTQNAHKMQRGETLEA